MACIEYIYSVSALVGNGSCNGNCSFCAAKNLRQAARTVDHLQYERQLETAIKLSSSYGGWSLSLTSSGEPTCDPDAVTRALRVYDKCRSEGRPLPNVNLFTNGILLGDTDFCNTYLPLWRSLGLTSIAVSVHGPSTSIQAKVYGVSSYPLLRDIYANIKLHGLGARATLLLSKEYICDAEHYRFAIGILNMDGFRNITSWSVGNPDGSRNEESISRSGLWGIRWWLYRNAKLCHGHSWGGGVYDYKGTLLRLTDYVTKHNPRKNFVRQLVVFQDGVTAYSWIREGALCMR